MGIPGIERPYPRITGSDGVGIVDAVGAGVDEDWIGKRIILNAATASEQGGIPEARPAGEIFTLVGEHGPGCLAEYFLAKATNVLDVGDADPIEAAAFGLVHLTAWRMLVTKAGIQPGMTILVPGIGGGVALASMGIALHHGCKVIVTSRSQDKIDQALALGAHYGILDEGQDFSKDVRVMTDGRGCDICAESVGKAIHGSCIKSLARGGVLVTCGATSGPNAATDLTRIFWNQLSIIGSTMGDMNEFRSVVALFKKGALRPVIDSIHPCHSPQKAYRRLEDASQFGKVMIDWR
jgi:NADPH:quinone reductase-like Zn-dependent oxidoreductase